MEAKRVHQRRLKKEIIQNKKLLHPLLEFFPANNPEYLTFVLFDEPEKNINDSYENTGGNTAAPTFSEIVKKISPILSPTLISINEEN